MQTAPLSRRASASLIIEFPPGPASGGEVAVDVNGHGVVGALDRAAEADPGAVGAGVAAAAMGDRERAGEARGAAVGAVGARGLAGERAALRVDGQFSW